MKKSFINDLALKMGRTETLMPDKIYVIEDEWIISEIEKLDDLEARDNDGRTLLHNAALYERITVVEYLLSHKVSIDARDAMGFTPLHFAVEVNNVEITKMLINAGADVNLKNKFGNNLLLLCNHNTSPTIFQLLLNEGVSPYNKNDYGVSAMDAFAAYPEVVKLLKSTCQGDDSLV